MMAHKQFLHELLKQDQEPFQLKTFIADKRSRLNNSSPSTTLQVKKRKPLAGETSTKSSNHSRTPCFFSFHNSSDVRKSPFLDFQSPAISPCSPGGAVFLHVPSKTAALLVEAAMRIKKQQRSKLKEQVRNARLSLFGSFLKILKHGSKNKVLKNYETKEKGELQEDIRISYSCGTHRPEEFDEINGDLALPKSRFCSAPVSPFRFSLHESPSSSGRRSPECCSPAASPIRPVTQEKGNYPTGDDSENANGVEEEKEQCSPVSVLDPCFEDGGDESVDAEEDDDYDLNCSYANIERTAQQLLNRLRRFEKLAALDPMELELKLLEGSDDEFHSESEEKSDDDEQLSLCRKQSLNTSSVRHNPRKMSTDLMAEEKSRIIFSRNKEVIVGRICNDAWTKVEFGMIGMMVELDFKREFEGWEDFPEEVEEAVAEVERAIFGVLLVEELSDELFYVDERHHELDCVPTECW